MRRLVAGTAMLMFSIVSANAQQNCGNTDVEKEETSRQAEVGVREVCQTMKRTGIWMGLLGAERKICHEEILPVLDEAVKKAACLCENNAHAERRPFGDLSFMRRNFENAFTPSAIQRLTAAYITQDADLAGDILSSELNSENKKLRIQSRLTIAQIALRADDDAGRKRLEAAVVEAKRLKFESADLSYLQAHAALNDGQLVRARQHLIEALRREPAFFNARFLNLVVAIRKWNTDGPTRCTANGHHIFNQLRALIALSPCPIHAAYIDASLASMRNVSPKALPVLVTRYALAAVSQAGSAATDIEAAIERQLSKSNLPVSCSVMIKGEYHKLKHSAHTGNLP